jgi:hypothetical protein
MDLGDPGDALRAEAERARRHAEELKAEARDRRARSAERRKTAGRPPAAAHALAVAEDHSFYCPRCNAVWRRVEVARAKPSCLVCDGPLVDLQPG